MKQLLTVFCCTLYMHNIAQAPLDIKIPGQRTSGERVLIKALTAIVNREGKKKTPVKRIKNTSHQHP